MQKGRAGRGTPHPGPSPQSGEGDPFVSDLVEQVRVLRLEAVTGVNGTSGWRYVVQIWQPRIVGRSWFGLGRQHAKVEWVLWLSPGCRCGWGSRCR
jgi:hypothetical protein